MKLFVSDACDVLITNWDVLNRDPVFGADRSYAFLEHYRPDMLEWLHRGGVLLVESQGASWGGLQDPYDTIVQMFPDSHVKLRAEMWTLGAQARVNDAHKSFPLAKELSQEDLTLQPGGLWARRGWFPKRLLRSDIYSLRFVRRHQQHLYRGWFESWSDDWIPVILADDNDPDSSEPDAGRADRAVALVRAVTKSESEGPLPETGFVVLTTMFIASSELAKLVSNVVSLPDRVRRE